MALTLAQLWGWLSDDRVDDGLLEWPPDVGALTAVLLERTHAFRFVVSPPAGGTWPPADFSSRVSQAAAQWRQATEGDAEIPALVQQNWDTLFARLDTPIADIGSGRDWQACEAALILHAIADEVWADPGTVFRAQALQRLAGTGSLATFPRDRVAHLPKSRTTSVGITHRSLSRYTCTTTDDIGVVWDRAPLRRPDRGPIRRHANILLLPWPLRISQADFVPVPGSVQRPEREPFGFFTYEPSEPLDLGLVDALLDAAAEEADAVDVVVLPEGRLDPAQITALEDLLARRGVPMMVTGMRPNADGTFARNAVHTSVFLGGRWWPYRQDKHHRWFLDAGQIETYSIAGALHPAVRWWEAMEIPQRQVHILDVGGGITVAAVICEDLARLDGVAALLRSVAPTLVVTLLLDGPQLGSRWTARYAGVLADDPGSAVLTLTPYGMVARSRPNGIPHSNVVAMWKDPARGLREIPLEAGAQAVLLTAVLDRSTRYAADGRRPADDATDLRLAGVHQIRATSSSSPAAGAAPSAPPMSSADLTVVTVWAQALARADDREAVLARMSRTPALDILRNLASGQEGGDSDLARVVEMAWRAAQEAVPS